MICRERQLQAFISSLFCLLVLAGGANAQPVALWGRWEQTFTAISTAAPETQFAVELNSPSGKVSTIAGFWDGGTTWRARFMPVEAGTWHYRTRSIPTIDGLDGKRGSFVCVKETGSNRFQRHGPIRVSANGTLFRACRRNTLLLDGRYSLVWRDIEPRIRLEHLLNGPC
jgi:Domain of unknown function (DUF5060)